MMPPNLLKNLLLNTLYKKIITMSRVLRYKNDIFKEAMLRSYNFEKNSLFFKKYVEKYESI
jgi:hypothetical protein